MRTCRVCLGSKELTEFKKKPTGLKGYDTICKSCYNMRNHEYNRNYNKSINGLAVRSWSRILERAGNADGEHPSYVNVKVKMTREEFMAWIIPELEQWLIIRPGVVPTIDRLDSKGHYEIGNIRLASKIENCLKVDILKIHKLLHLTMTYAKGLNFSEDKFLEMVNEQIKTHPDYGMGSDLD